MLKLKISIIGFATLVMANTINGQFDPENFEIKFNRSIGAYLTVGGDWQQTNEQNSGYRLKVQNDVLIEEIETSAGPFKRFQLKRTSSIASKYINGQKVYIWFAESENGGGLHTGAVQALQKGW